MGVPMGMFMFMEMLVFMPIPSLPIEHTASRYRFFKFLKNFVEALSQGFSSLEKFNDWKMFN